jgi:G:T-mismatch repair DNA endonuclease (very short patch repair protein)
MDALKKEGWEVIIIWECELKSKKTNETLTKLFGRITTFPRKK